jgi:hypothetical protein
MEGAGYARRAHRLDKAKSSLCFSAGLAGPSKAGFEAFHRLDPASQAGVNLAARQVGAS